MHVLVTKWSTGSTPWKTTLFKVLDIHLFWIYAAYFLEGNIPLSEGLKSHCWHKLQGLFCLLDKMSDSTWKLG
jgi:hypothetical protein